jgi:hypothetical protein
MTTDQIGSIIRSILIFAGGWAVSQGWLDNATMQTIVGGAVTILTAIWGVYTNRAAKVVNMDTGKPKSVTP